MKITKNFYFFYGGTFSQWHPCTFTIGGITYNCAEQYMMAEKARLFSDQEAEKEIMLADHPREQKAIGRSVRGFDANQWNQVAKDVVYRGNQAKFTQNPQFKKELLSTGTKTLVEASGYDKIWGIGLWESDDRCLDPTQWLGTNWLGEVLTKLRNDLKGK